MKIGLIGSRGFPYVYSGYETFVAELAPRLVERGHLVTVYCHRALFYPRPKVVSGVHLVYLPSIESKILSQLTHSLISTVHACFSESDVLIYVNSANGPFGLITRLWRKKTAINVDGLEWLRPKWKGIGARYFRMSSYLSAKLFDTVVADSVRMEEIYRHEFNADPVTIAYGANIGFSVDRELILEMGLTPDDYYLIVGRLIPDNNADLIVRGFEKTTSAKKLVILGDVPYRDEYAEGVRSTKDSRILFPGYIRDPNILRELYCNAFAYVHGHEFGGTNPSLLQALANGCCVLALDTPFSREVLDDETHGLYFQKNPGSFTSLVIRVESDPSVATQLRGTSRSRIKQKYTWDHITDQYEQLLRLLVQ